MHLAALTIYYSNNMIKYINPLRQSTMLSIYDSSILKIIGLADSLQKMQVDPNMMRISRPRRLI